MDKDNQSKKTKATSEDISLLKKAEAVLLKQIEETDKLLKDIRERIAKKKAKAAKNLEDLTTQAMAKPTSEEEEELKELYGDSLSDDLELLEERVWALRAKKRTARGDLTRKAILTDGLKKTARINEDTLEKIRKGNEQAWENFLFSGKPLKLKSNRKALELSAKPLIKSAFSAALYTEIKVNRVINENGNQKRKKESMLLKDVLELVYKQTIGQVTKAIGTAVDTTVKAVTTRVAASKVGGTAIRTVSNLKTVAGKIGNTVAKVADVGKVVGHVAKGAVRAAIPAAAVYIATGGAALPVAATFGTIAIARGVQGVLADPSVAKLTWLQNVKEKYGYGKFRNPNGTWKVSVQEQNAIKAKIADVNKVIDARYAAHLQEIAELQARANGLLKIPGSELEAQALQSKIANMKKLDRLTLATEEAEQLKLLTKELDAATFRFSNLAKGLRIFNSGAGWGSIGYMLGSLVGAGLPGFVAGTAIGAGGQYLIDKLLVNTLGKSKFLGILSRVPLLDLYGQVSSNLWLASQIQLIKNSYNWDVGRYLKENFAFSDPDKGPVLNSFISVANYIQLANVFVSATSLGAGFTSLINFGRTIAPQLFRGGAGALTMGRAAAGGAMAIGTVSALIALSLLGVEIGVVAITAATVGAFVGLTAAALVLGTLSFPVALLASFAGAGLFGWIGSFFDKAINKALGGFMNFVNGIAVLLQLVSLLMRSFDTDNIIMIALGMIGLMQTLTKMGEFSNDNIKLVGSEETSSISAPAKLAVEQLGFYNVTLLKNGNLPVSARENLISYLESNSDMLSERFKGKQIYLSTGASGAELRSFEAENFVLLSIDREVLFTGDMNALEKSILGQLPNLAQIAGVADLEQNLLGN